jgi:hypothetical protein
MADGSKPLSAEERREARRKSMVWGKASSFEELEAKDLEFWSERSLEEKFEATMQLVVDSWYVQGNRGPPPRLDRSVYGIRKLRG